MQYCNKDKCRSETWNLMKTKIKKDFPITRDWETMTLKSQQHTKHRLIFHFPLCHPCGLNQRNDCPHSSYLI
ncbi:hypothetical protein EUGRSUZ_J01086 [Eucalyptus grandis]|uniref:Uncharacterized protein n=2 Tax=Eucalyptus grandis TaxID=71139 RepID=A0ACC3J4E0_EUCGR|nr:hypothetical protein EUGRSUZ_J01086 [Eucalyptus grandis]